MSFVWMGISSSIEQWWARVWIGSNPDFEKVFFIQYTPIEFLNMGVGLKKIQFYMDFPNLKQGCWKNKK